MGERLKALRDLFRVLRAGQKGNRMERRNRRGEKLRHQRNIVESKTTQNVIAGGMLSAGTIMGLITIARQFGYEAWDASLDEMMTAKVTAVAGGVGVLTAIGGRIVSSFRDWRRRRKERKSAGAGVIGKPFVILLAAAIGLGGGGCVGMGAGGPPVFDPSLAIPALAEAIQVYEDIQARKLEEEGHRDRFRKREDARNVAFLAGAADFALKWLENPDAIAANPLPALRASLVIADNVVKFYGFNVPFLVLNASVEEGVPELPEGESDFYLRLLIEHGAILLPSGT